MNVETWHCHVSRGIATSRVALPRLAWHCHVSRGTARELMDNARDGPVGRLYYVIIAKYMVKKYQQTFRVPSARLNGWDYSSEGMYFVTICTKNRRCWFGDCHDGTMILSNVGRIIQSVWEGIPTVYSCAFLDRFIVMPNHIHGIIGIQKTDRPIEAVKMSLSILKPQSLGSIIGQFKSITTKLIRGMYAKDFAWQPRFYDHVVRNEQALDRIRTYIFNNPANWDQDEHYPNRM